jgi:hypothetical protein
MKPEAIPPGYVQTGPDTYAHYSLVGALPAPKSQPVSRRPQGDAGRQATRQSGLGRRGRILLVRCSRRALDTDNLVAAYKSLRDAIAADLAPGLPPGRADEHYDWGYGQHITGGEQGTIVRIEL